MKRDVRIHVENEQQPRGPQSILEVSCPRCRRPYRIRQSRIPKDATAVHCKDCGCKIRLRQTCMPSTRSPFHRAPPRLRVDLMTPEKRQPRSRLAARVGLR